MYLGGPTAVSLYGPVHIKLCFAQTSVMFQVINIFDDSLIMHLVGISVCSQINLEVNDRFPLRISESTVNFTSLVQS